MGCRPLAPSAKRSRRSTNGYTYNLQNIIPTIAGLPLAFFFLHTTCHSLPRKRFFSCSFFTLPMLLYGEPALQQVLLRRLSSPMLSKGGGVKKLAAIKMSTLRKKKQVDKPVTGPITGRLLFTTMYWYPCTQIGACPHIHSNQYWHLVYRIDRASDIIKRGLIFIQVNSLEASRRSTLGTRRC